MFHADGADASIALCEVQGYVYAAKLHAARLAQRLGKHATGKRLDRAAERLRAQFDEAFWCEELSTYALALDGDKRPCRVRASNAGHALYTGIALPERAAPASASLSTDTRPMSRSPCLSGRGRPRCSWSSSTSRYRRHSSCSPV